VGATDQRSFDLVALPGDGIGPEVVAAACSLLDALAAGGDFEFEITELPVGGNSIDQHGVPLLPDVLERCRTSDAVLLGAVGGPKWDTTDPDAPRPEQGLLGLRKGLGLFANLRPVRVSDSLIASSPLRDDRIAGADLLVVRELTGGIYFGERGRSDSGAYDTCVYSEGEVERIARLAFEIASSGSRPGRVTSVDKANILETSRLWREVVERVAPDYPQVSLEHMLVDNAAMQLVARPTDFDVILTENMFGDILSDEAAMITGSIGMLASASLGGDGGPGLYEPVHGSAPDIAGQGIANPLATFGSVALMFRHSLRMENEAAAVESAIDRVLERGMRTADLATGAAGEARSDTVEMTDAVIGELQGTVAATTKGA
jgi:3-isopropylmalate dehydrogenase